MVPNAPRGLQRCNAEEVWHWMAFRRRFNQGVLLAVMAYVVRLRVVKTYGVWFFDCDTFWSRQISRCSGRIQHGDTWLAQCMRGLMAGKAQDTWIVCGGPGGLCCHTIACTPFGAYYWQSFIILTRNLEQQVWAHEEHNNFMRALCAIGVKFGLEQARVAPCIFSIALSDWGVWSETASKSRWGEGWHALCTQCCLMGQVVNAFTQPSRAQTTDALERGALQGCHSTSLSWGLHFHALTAESRKIIRYYYTLLFVVIINH